MLHSETEIAPLQKKTCIEKISLEFAPAIDIPKTHPSQFFVSNPAPSCWKGGGGNRILLVLGKKQKIYE